MTVPALGDMRLGDLMTFLAVLRSDSISNAARELGVSPSQVSKAVARLEAVWGVRLLTRNSRGVTLTEAGERARPHVVEAIAHLRSVGDAARTTRLTVAAPSSLIEAFLPAIATSAREVQVRGLVLPPQLLRADASENVFDAALLTADHETLPPSWVASALGSLRQALFASPAVASRLGREPVGANRLRSVPFVVPVFRVAGRFVAVEDDCPLPFRDRIVGHEAQTIGLALTLAAATDQLVFGPVVAAHEHVRAGRLVEVEVEGWDTRDALYFACNGDRLMAALQRKIVRALRTALEERDPRGA